MKAEIGDNMKAAIGLKMKAALSKTLKAAKVRRHRDSASAHTGKHFGGFGLPGRRQRAPMVEALPDGTMATDVVITPEQVQTLVLAMTKLCNAAFRASTLGQTVQVEVPDEATAMLFRATLEETAKQRATDRMIEVVVKQAEG